jgi:hypothetical protein
LGGWTKHHEWREGSDPFNARQPGEVAKVPQSAWKQERCGDSAKKDLLLPFDYTIRFSAV